MTGASVVRDIPRENPEPCHNIISAPQMLFSLTRLGPKISIQGLVLIGAGYLLEIAAEPQKSLAYSGLRLPKC